MCFSQRMNLRICLGLCLTLSIAACNNDDDENTQPVDGGVDSGLHDAGSLLDATLDASRDAAADAS